MEELRLRIVHLWVDLWMMTMAVVVVVNVLVLVMAGERFPSRGHIVLVVGHMRQGRRQCPGQSRSRGRLCPRICSLMLLFCLSVWLFFLALWRFAAFCQRLWPFYLFSPFWSLAF